MFRVALFVIFMLFSSSSFSLDIKGDSLNWIGVSPSSFKYELVTFLGGKVYKYKNGKMDVGIRNNPSFDYVVKLVNGTVTLSVFTGQKRVSGFMMEVITNDISNYL